jgi:hypothetical protein
MKFDSTVLLASMRRGYAYSATNLAHQHGQTTAGIRELLGKLVQEGHVQVFNQSSRTIQFVRVEARPASGERPEQEEAVGAPSVATFPENRNIDSELTGYEASLMRHRALAMLGRNGR